MTDGLIAFRILGMSHITTSLVCLFFLFVFCLFFFSRARSWTKSGSHCIEGAVVLFQVSVCGSVGGWVDGCVQAPPTTVGGGQSASGCRRHLPLRPTVGSLVGNRPFRVPGRAPNSPQHPPRSSSLFSTVFFDVEKRYEPTSIRSVPCARAKVNSSTSPPSTSQRNRL